jgi:DNA polymerase III delta subunit
MLAIFQAPERVVRMNSFEFTAVREALETASLFGGETIVVLDEVDKLLKGRCH